MSDSKRIVLCADDFGQNDSICAAIVDLVEKQRLTAVSCFADAPSLRRWSNRLLSHTDTIDIGLHFNLTQNFGYQERPLSYWLSRGCIGRIDPLHIRYSLTRQLKNFREIFNRWPDFIDGHQHVQCFPTISAEVDRCLQTFPPAQMVYLRSLKNISGRSNSPMKRLVLRALAFRLEPPSVPVNRTFCGDYALTGDEDYAQLFESWLSTSRDGTLIMCHPGLAPTSAQDHDQNDTIRCARIGEYNFFRSDLFRDLCIEYDIKIYKGAKLFKGSQGLLHQLPGNVYHP